MKQLTYILPALLTLFASCSKELGKLPENAKVDGNTVTRSENSRGGAEWRLLSFRQCAGRQ